MNMNKNMVRKKRRRKRWKWPKREKEIKSQNIFKGINAPKRAISAFFFYNNEKKPKLMKERQELDNKEIIKQWVLNGIT